MDADAAPAGKESPSAPAPAEETEVEGAGGVRLFLRRWAPAEGTAPRGLLAIVPGFSDHGGRYPKLVQRAQAEGFAVAALDTRGHGRSSGRRGHVESFDEFLLDVDRFLAHARRSWLGGAPLVIWGHSMGALITLAYLSAGFGRGAGLAAAVACAPPFKISTPIPGWKKALARQLSRWAPTVPFASAVRPQDLSRDLRVGLDYLKDPLVHHVCSPRLFTEMGATAARLLANPLDYGVPTLFIHGTGDLLVDPAGTRSYHERSPLAEKALRLYADARHEVHNDPAVDEAWRDARAFFERFTARPAAPQPAGAGAG